MTRFFRRRIVAWASRDLGASTGGTPMSQCEPDGSRGFHGIKGSEPRVQPRVYPGNWVYTAFVPRRVVRRRTAVVVGRIPQKFGAHR
jgi:hypothetical protein